jgi:RNA polymerase sigma-70 factor (ECF subfamily)
VSPQPPTQTCPASCDHSTRETSVSDRNYPRPRSELEGVEQRTEDGAGGVSAQPLASLEYWMSRYQQADPAAPGALIASIGPALLRFFRYNSASREYAEDLLQETWLKIHRMRHSYRPGEAVLPWVYAIARHVRVDSYRRVRRILAHEAAADVLPEAVGRKDVVESALQFDALVAQLPDSQREVIVMLKATGMTVEEVALATSSTVGAVKLKAHRAYESLRALLTSRPTQRSGKPEGAQ